MNNNDYYDDQQSEQDSSDKISNSTRSAYNGLQNVRNDINQINNMRNRISKSKQANSISDGKNSSDDNNLQKNKNFGLEKKDGLDSKNKGISDTDKKGFSVSSKEAKKATSSASSDIAKNAASKEISSAGTKAVSSSAAKTAASTGAKAAASAGTKAAAGTAAKTTIVAAVTNPVTWIVLAAIVGIIVVFCLMIFIKVNVIDNVGLKYNISPDDMVYKYDGMEIEFGNKQSMDIAFNNTDGIDNGIFDSIASWFNSIFGSIFNPSDAERLINKIVNNIQKEVGNNVVVTPGLTIATFMSIYDERSITNETDDNSDNDLVVSLDMLWDMLVTKNIDMYDVMMNDFVKYDYEYYTYAFDEEKQVYYCKLHNSSVTYQRNDDRFKLFLKYGDNTSDKYQEYLNIKKSYEATSNECLEELSFGVSEKQVQDFLSKAINESYLENNFTGDFNLKNGFLYQKDDMLDDENYTNKLLYKDITKIITNNFLREEDVNRFLGYSSEVFTPGVVNPGNGSYTGSVGNNGISFTNPICSAGYCGSYVTRILKQVLSPSTFSYYSSKVAHNAFATWCRNYDLGEKGFKSGSVPKTGSVAVFYGNGQSCYDVYSTNRNPNKGKCGHIVFIEEVFSDGTMRVNHCTGVINQGIVNIEQFEKKFGGLAGYIYVME